MCRLTELLQIERGLEYFVVVTYLHVSPRKRRLLALFAVLPSLQIQNSVVQWREQELEHGAIYLGVVGRRIVVGAKLTSKRFNLSSQNAKAFANVPTSNRVIA